MTSGPAPTVLPLFVYGTLLDESLTAHLLGHPVRSEPARLLDFGLLETNGMAYPTVVRAPGEMLAGRLFRELTRDDFAQLDAYEGVAEGLYRRIEARVVAGPRARGPWCETAFVYVISGGKRLPSE